MKKGIFMPGRLNSERLPNKLILPIGNTCLWEIACKKLAEISDEFEKCVVVSEEDSILIDIANDNNLKVILRDPQTTKIDNPLTEVFADIKKMESDIVMFLNPCLPFLKKETIEEALSYIDFYHYMESVIPFNSWIYDETGLCTYVDLREMNTKTNKILYQPAHAFRIFNKEEFFETGKMSQNKPLFGKITKKESLDVDTKEDYEFIKWRLENET